MRENKHMQEEDEIKVSYELTTVNNNCGKRLSRIWMITSCC
jgi:hypothetical protein